jgi:hypothetical protein
MHSGLAPPLASRTFEHLPRDPIDPLPRHALADAGLKWRAGARIRPMPQPMVRRGSQREKEVQKSM